MSSVQIVAGPNWVLGPSFPDVRIRESSVFRSRRRRCRLAIYHLNP
jgi:hypothetical protein